MKYMNRVILLMTVSLLLLAGTVEAQVFIANDEFEGVLRDPTEEYTLVVPYEGTEGDQFTPLGEGLLSLTLLGGAYLLRKRKKEK